MAESVVFTYEQLKALLIGCGYSKICGLGLGGPKLEDSRFAAALNQMANRGLLQSDGKRFIRSKAAADISDRIGTADIYCAIHTSNAAVPDICCYPGEKLMVCALSLTSPSVAVRFSSFSDLFEELCDEGYLPQAGEPMPLDEEQLEAFEAEALRGYEPNQPIVGGSAVLFSVEIISSDATILAFARVIRYYFYDYILFELQSKRQRILFSREELKACLQRMLSQNDYC